MSAWWWTSCESWYVWALQGWEVLGYSTKCLHSSNGVDWLGAESTKECIWYFLFIWHRLGMEMFCWSMCPYICRHWFSFHLLMKIYVWCCSSLIACYHFICRIWFYLFYFQYLKSVTADIGRNVRREHLLVVADSLSVTGQFHALSSQGLKQQHTRLSISSPFSEACFSVSNLWFN